MIQDLAITASIGVGAQCATDPATCQAPPDSSLQESAGVYRQGGCLDWQYAGCRLGHLGGDQVPGRHGHPADLHVYLAHDRGTGTDSGLVAFPADKGPLAGAE